MKTKLITLCLLSSLFSANAFCAIADEIQEAVNLTTLAKTYSINYYHNTPFVYNKQFPSNSSIAGYAGASGIYVSKVEIGNGSVIATFGSNANSALQNKTIIYRPIIATNGTGPLTWECTSSIRQKYLPNGCNRVRR